jgi:hypothetical protein
LDGSKESTENDQTPCRCSEPGFGLNLRCEIPNLIQIDGMCPWLRNCTQVFSGRWKLATNSRDALPYENQTKWRIRERREARTLAPIWQYYWGRELTRIASTVRRTTTSSVFSILSRIPTSGGARRTIVLPCRRRYFYCITTSPHLSPLEFGHVCLRPSKDDWKTFKGRFEATFQNSALRCVSAVRIPRGTLHIEWLRG